jgi:tetraacyldisaccharide 4'-kinase
MREPPFWWRAAGIEAHLLAPAAAIYGAVAASRLARDGTRAGAPVLCVGNPTVGGAGKTPLALALARMLQAADERPVFLSRGYGGRLAGPLQVEASRHRAAEVGDEPLLLARVAPTIVARDRIGGASLALAAGASVIVMDDGFQNPSLTKDVAILVVDAGRGIGNARVIPAGPLRAPLAAQLRRAHAVVVVGAGNAAHEVAAAARARGIAVFAARFAPDRDAVAALKSGRALAFAGIGDPKKFFATLAESGITMAARRPFADHHGYTRDEAAALCNEADRGGLALVTTEKDLARLQGDAATAELAKRARALPVRLVLDEEAAFKAFVLARLAAARRARASA